MRCVFTYHKCGKCGKEFGSGRPPANCTECGFKLRCSRHAVIGMTVCHRHGGGKGRTLGIKRIPGHPSTWSENRLIREASYMVLNIPPPQKSMFKSRELSERYEAALVDPELVAMRKPLAVISARVLQLLERVQDGVTTELWERATKTYGDLKDAIRIDDELATKDNIATLDSIFEQVEDDYKAWGQVFEALELQRKLSESERKRLLDMKQFITAEEAMKMVRALTAAIYKNVKDPISLRQIIYEFNRITGSPTERGSQGLGGESQEEFPD